MPLVDSETTPGRHVARRWVPHSAAACPSLRLTCGEGIRATGAPMLAAVSRFQRSNEVRRGARHVALHSDVSRSWTYPFGYGHSSSVDGCLALASCAGWDTAARSLTGGSCMSTELPRGYHTRSAELCAKVFGVANDLRDGIDHPPAMDLFFRFRGRDPARVGHFPDASPSSI